MMNKIKIFGSPVLNFFDLHNNFSPLELFSQINSFIDFAEIHCLPLSSHIKDSASGAVYFAEFLTKDFWLKVLRDKERSSEESAVKIFQNILGDSEKMMKELADSAVNEKIDDIRKKSGQSLNNSMLLLAICELAEIDARTVESSHWKLQREEKSSPSSEIFEFLYEDDKVSLQAGGHIYRYYYYDGKELPEGSVIKTVRIDVKSSSNQFAEVKIELYSEKLKRTVQNISLKQGEYRYCNVADGKIIKFLPCISITSQRCILRKDYSKSDLTILTKGAEVWTVNAENVSSFSAGTKRSGFILVQDGKINYSFYEPAKDYFMRLNLDMIQLPVVEAIITSDGYIFLLEDGNILSDYYDAKGHRVVSLVQTGRYPFPEVKGISDYCEAVVSKAGIAVITRNISKNYYVQFAGENSSVKNINDNNNNIIEINKGEKL